MGSRNFFLPVNALFPYGLEHPKVSEVAADDNTDLIDIRFDILALSYAEFYYLSLSEIGR